MRRFWVDPDAVSTSGQTLELDGDEFHHMRNVARLEEGERLELLTGDGRIAVGKILKIAKKSAEIEVESIQKLDAPKAPLITIALGVPRFQKMDLILQKCVELNAFKIIPMVSEKSFVKTLSSDLKGKIPRWRKIALEACKQSGRAWPLELTEPQALDTVLKAAGDQSHAALFLYEGMGVVDIKTALERIRQSQGRIPQKLTCFVGAEGGFSPGEVEKFKQAGFLPVTLGPLVLRVETACIALLSIIQYEFDYMK